MGQESHVLIGGVCFLIKDRVIDVIGERHTQPRRFSTIFSKYTVEFYSEKNNQRRSLQQIHASWNVQPICIVDVYAFGPKGLKFLQYPVFFALKKVQIPNDGNRWPAENIVRRSRNVL